MRIREFLLEEDGVSSIEIVYSLKPSARSLVSSSFIPSIIGRRLIG